MGIFSLFGKKDGQPAPEPADREPSRKKRGDGSPRGDSVTEAGRAQIIQRSAARATAMKIDAIESEMSSEFVRPARTAANNTIPVPAATSHAPASPAKKPEAKKKAAGFQATLPMGTTTGFFLGSDTLPGSVLLSASEATPVIEEAAILFANGQSDMVEHVLQDAFKADLGASALTVWAMLLELYQVTGRRAEFDSLSIEYASKFETSPPAWFETEVEQVDVPVAVSKSTPTIPFSGRLDSTIVKQLERLKKMAEANKVLRLEFVRVTDVDPVGCGILLNVLKRLQKTGHDLILVGALDLVAKIRAILEVGRRDETEAPWLLLMEVLQLLNLEKDFEEASIDYCITFEVSPPPFVAPKTKVTMALDDPASKEESPHFMMPVVIEGSTDQLIQAIGAYAAENNPAILDCVRLTRVDFGATGQLLAGLAPLTGGGVRIELHNVNHLVAALFNVMGLKDIVKIVPRKR